MMTTARRRRSGAFVAAAAVLAALSLSGCASGFVSGGVATASARDGRIDIDSRSGTAAIGPAGPSIEAQRRSGSVCIDRVTGAAVAC